MDLYGKMTKMPLILYGKMTKTHINLYGKMTKFLLVF